MVGAPMMHSLKRYRKNMFYVKSLQIMIEFFAPYSMEPGPDEQVELSLLRQCLENAMATELSPHERDIIRLRLGLDDGVTRTVPEVVDVCGGTLSSMDVRNAEQRAFNKLRSPYAVHAEQLLAYLDFIGVTIETLPKRWRR